MTFEPVVPFEVQGRRVTRAAYDEVDYPALHARPHPATVRTLAANDDAIVMYRERLPARLE